MKRLFLASTIIATSASLGPQATAHGLPPSGVAPRASCTALTGLTLPNTQILSATQKSGYCNVVGIINKRVSTQDPDHFTYGIGFALNLPNTWHGRFEMMGGGDLCHHFRVFVDDAGEVHHLAEVFYFWFLQ